MLLSTLPVITIGCLSYTKASTEIEDKVTKENMQVLLQTKMRVEHQLESLDTSVNQSILSSSFLSDFQKNLTSKDFIAYRNLSKVLKRFQTNKIWYDNVELVNNDKKWVISKKGLSHLSSEEYSKRYTHIATISPSSDWLTYSKDQNQSIKLVKKLPLLSREPKGLLVITITKDKISQLVNENNQTEDIYIVDKEYQLLSKNNLHPNSFPSEDIINKIKNSPSDNGYFTTTLDGNYVGINFSRSTFNHWTYISIVSIEAITKESKGIAWFIAIYCLAIIVIVSLIALQWSRRLYNPIRDIYKSVASLSIEGTDPKTNDEFDCIHESILYFRNHKRELEEQMKDYLEHVREFFVLKLLLGQVKPAEIKDMLEKLNFPDSWNSLAVITIQIDSLEQTKYKTEDKQSLLVAINNIVRDEIKEQKYFSPVFLDDYQITILVNNSKNSLDQKKYFNTVAQTIQTVILRHLDIKVSIGISRSYKKLEDTVLGYEEAIEALRYQYQLEPGVIINNDDITNNQSIGCNYPKQVSKDLIEAIKSGNLLESKRLLNELLSYMIDINLPYHNAQIILAQFLSKLLELVQEVNESPLELFGKKLVFDELFKLTSISEVEDWFNKEIIPPIVQKYEELRTNQQTNITDRVISIIDEEYYKDLTLEYVASKINFHPSYVSRVFKKETGSSFSDYLMTYRINQIKKLLSETNIKISEIAERFHYNSSASFIRSFRKVEGITPGQYRKNNF